MRCLSSLFNIAAGILAMAVLAGCASGLAQDRLDRRFYAFEVRREARPLPLVGETLKVRRIDVGPAYAGRSLVYRTGPGVYESDYYNLFLVAPDEQLTQATRSWLSDSGLFRQVVLGGSDIQTSLVLEGSVVELYGDFSGGRPGTAVIEAQFFLLDEGAATPGIRLSQKYRRMIPMTEDTAEALIRAYDEAIASMLADLEARIAEELAG